MRKTMAIILTAAAAGCSNPLETSQEMAFATAHQRWEQARPALYEYRVQVFCFCGYTDMGPVAVRVLGDSTVSATFVSDGTPADTAMYGRYLTMDRVFAAVWDALQRADSVGVAYDPDSGIPLEVSIDWYRNAADDELSFRVTDFAVLPLAVP